MITIIYAHPHPDSFNNAILKQVIQRADEAYQVIDLNQDLFDPVLNKKDLENYHQSQSFDPLVKQYQRMLEKTDKLVIIFPIWWYGPPAILKGFLDKVLLEGFAFDLGLEGQLLGLLTNIKEVDIITSAQVTKKDLMRYHGDPIQNTLINSTLKIVGMSNFNWLHIDSIATGNKEDRIDFLNSI